METLKEIINTLKIIGISVAGITFVVFVIKIATESEMKSKYLKLTKHLLIATILITVSLSLVEIPKYRGVNKKPNSWSNCRSFILYNIFDYRKYNNCYINSNRSNSCFINFFDKGK